MQHIVQETNRYARQYMNEYPDKAQNSYVGNWNDVTVPELKKNFGLVILMGIVHKPRLPYYWSTDDLYWTPIFDKSITRNRFNFILKFLHFNDNNDPEYDINDENRERLDKIHPFLEMISGRCRRVYQPGKHLSVYESLVLFKGRLHFKQYIRTKRAGFGIKLYELTTPGG